MHTEIILVMFINLELNIPRIISYNLCGFFAILANFWLFLQFCTLIGMWSIPLLLSLKNLWWRFIGLWLLFTLVTAAIMRRAMEKPIQGSTPRYGILFPKLFWPSVRKNCSCDFQIPRTIYSNRVRIIFECLLNPNWTGRGLN